jgi:hypothetical protein
MGVGTCVFGISFASVMQLIVPDAFLGRVIGVSRFVTAGGFSVGSIIGGYLGYTVGLRATLIIGAIGMFSAVSTLLFSPLLKTQRIGATNSYGGNSKWDPWYRTGIFANSGQDKRRRNSDSICDLGYSINHSAIFEGKCFANGDHGFHGVRALAVFRFVSRGMGRPATATSEINYGQCMHGNAASGYPDSGVQLIVTHRRECVLNLLSADLVSAVDRLALLTGADPMPEYKKQVGYRYEPDKFGSAGMTQESSGLVKAPPVTECPVKLETTLTQVNNFSEPSFLAVVEVTIIRVHIELIF